MAAFLRVVLVFSLLENSALAALVEEATSTGGCTLLGKTSFSPQVKNCAQ